MSNSPFLIQELHVQTGDTMEMVRLKNKKNKHSITILIKINRPAREYNQTLNK